MPLAFTLGFASLAGLFMGSIDFVVMPQRMMHAIDSFPLISIPLFMVAGELMVEGGIMDRLVDFANSVVGRVHGGLAHVAVLTGALLASVSGSAVASASAIGSSMVPSLRKYYDDGYSSAVIAAAANLGPIIPPSGAMIMYTWRPDWVGLRGRRWPGSAQRSYLTAPHSIRSWLPQPTVRYHPGTDCGPPLGRWGIRSRLTASWAARVTA